MFFLVMTSLLSLPLHHLLFSVWAAHLPVFFPTRPPDPHSSGPPLSYPPGFGVGLEALLALKLVRRPARVAGCCLTRKPSVSLSTQNSCGGGGERSCQLENINIGVSNRSSVFWNRPARLCSAAMVLSAHGGGACMAECVTRPHLHARST